MERAFPHRLLKMDVGEVRYPVGQFGQFQVMRRDESEGACATERQDIGAAADQPLAIVRPAKNLIDQEQHRRRVWPFRGGKNPLQTFHFGIKM